MFTLTFTGVPRRRSSVRFEVTLSCRPIDYLADSVLYIQASSVARYQAASNEATVPLLGLNDKESRRTRDWLLTDELPLGYLDDVC